MFRTKHILNDTKHRSWPLSSGRWQYYQEWNQALFLHWEIPFDVIRKCVPEKLMLDSLDGKYYVSLVVFNMQNIRPRNLPALSFISDFHEINLRTYINKDGRRGVYFLSLEAEKFLSTYLAKNLSGLAYKKSKIKRIANKIFSKNELKKVSLEVDYAVGEKVDTKTALDTWLTERYCAYLEIKGQIFVYHIHHQEWPIKQVEIKKLTLNYNAGEMLLSERPPDLAHYSEGVKVLTWAKENIDFEILID